MSRGKLNISSCLWNECCKCWLLMAGLVVGSAFRHGLQLSWCAIRTSSSCLCWPTWITWVRCFLSLFALALNFRTPRVYVYVRVYLYVHIHTLRLLDFSLPVSNKPPSIRVQERERGNFTVMVCTVYKYILHVPVPRRRAKAKPTERVKKKKEQDWEMWVELLQTR